MSRFEVCVNWHSSQKLQKYWFFFKCLFKFFLRQCYAKYAAGLYWYCPQFWTEDFELAQGCQSTARTYNLLPCQKQRHEEKTTIQSCIILLGDRGKMELCLGIVLHFKPLKRLCYFRFLPERRSSSLWITSVSSHHLWQQTTAAGDSGTHPGWTRGNRQRAPMAYVKKYHVFRL